MHVQVQTTFKPTKLRAYNSSKAAIVRAIDQAGGIKAVAHLLGKSKSLLYKLTDPMHRKHHISFDTVCQLARCGTVTAPAEYLAALCGGHFVPGEPSDEPLNELAARAAIECGSFTAAVLTKAQPEDTLKEIDAVIRSATKARSRLIAQIEAH